MNDLRFAFRQLLKNPGFTAVAVLTLALGTGANLALFTILDDQFLRPRPVLRPDELWSIVPADASGEPRFFNFSRPYYDAIRQYNRVFKDLITINGLSEKLRTSDGWEEIFGHMVTANYFDFVGVHPIVGVGSSRKMTSRVLHWSPWSAIVFGRNSLKETRRLPERR